MDIDQLDRDSAEWQPLWQFFAVYLNQDLYHDYGDPWRAAAAYVDQSPRSDITATAEAARRLASEFIDDETTEQAAGRLGLAYSPRADGLSCRGWLNALADFLESGD